MLDWWRNTFNQKAPPVPPPAASPAPPRVTIGIGHNGGPLLLPEPTDHPDQFLACIPTILAAEGGFVNDPRDPGGATNRGITLATLSDWRHHPCTVADITALTELEARQIYRAKYWNAIRGDDLPEGLALEVFDLAVNAGSKVAVRLLQQCCGMNDVDGVMGPATLAVVRAMPDQAGLIHRYAAARRSFYRGLPTFGHFGGGWINRANAVEQLATRMAA
jgi:lysozyme family protein